MKYAHIKKQSLLYQATGHKVYDYLVYYFIKTYRTNYSLKSLFKIGINKLLLLADFLQDFCCLWRSALGVYFIYHMISNVSSCLYEQVFSPFLMRQVNVQCVELTRVFIHAIILFVVLRITEYCSW